MFEKRFNGPRCKRTLCRNARSHQGVALTEKKLGAVRPPVLRVATASRDLPTTLALWKRPYKDLVLAADTGGVRHETFVWRNQRPRLCVFWVLGKVDGLCLSGGCVGAPQPDVFGLGVGGVTQCEISVVGSPVYNRIKTVGQRKSPSRAGTVGRLYINLRSSGRRLQQDVINLLAWSQPEGS